MVQQRKRPPSTIVAWVRFRTPSHICTELVDSIIRIESFFVCLFVFFSPGIPLFAVSSNKRRLINAGTAYISKYYKHVHVNVKSRLLLLLLIY